MVLPGNGGRPPAVVDGDDEGRLVAVLRDGLAEVPEAGEGTVELHGSAEVTFVRALVGPVVRLAVGNVQGAGLHRLDGMPASVGNEGVEEDAIPDGTAVFDHFREG